MESELSADKHEVARRTTRVSITLNILLAGAQLVTGVLAHSQALLADGLHSLADLIADFAVLLANRHSGARADDDHNYGHSRYETVAALFLGSLLVVVGAGMLWRAGERVTDLDALPPVKFAALAVALVVLVSKEALFRYMLRGAVRVRSAMLIANAWHARGDAASSLVVALGVIGSLAGWRLLDPIAAAVVGFLVGKMGFSYAWDALQDLSDRALDQTSTEQIRSTLLGTPGVRGLHELRTRKMGDMALVDAHILVDPKITVSEGHYIAESARERVMHDTRVLDALIHVDPEDDELGRPPPGLPTHDALLAQARAVCARRGVRVESAAIHYLRRGIEMDLQVSDAPGEAADPRPASLDPETLRKALGVRRVRLLRAAEAGPASVER